jgi:hypothetical protein
MHGRQMGRAGRGRVLRKRVTETLQFPHHRSIKLSDNKTLDGLIVRKARFRTDLSRDA